MEALRRFAEQFPPIKIALYVHDVLCYVFSSFLDLVFHLVQIAFKLIYRLIKISYGPIYRGVSWSCSKLSDAIPPIRRFKEERARRRYERLESQKSKHHQLDDTAPPYYGDQTMKRAITYHAALLLAVGMYIFVYFVLIKQHTYWTVSIAFVLMLIYLLLVENSHNVRSILMLCLPIMLTNRGRALVFCSMLALLAGGPISTMQHNIREIHLSLNCCKQYLIVNTDKNVNQNVVSKLVKVEEVVINLVNNIKMLVDDLKEKFDSIIQLAIETEMFISNTVQQLKRALTFCNRHTDDIGINCRKSLNNIQANCNTLGFRLCDFFGNIKEICQTKAVVTDALCELPRHVVQFFEQTIGKKLREYVDLVAREFYVDVDVTRSYGYNVTKSKAYSEMIREIKFDVDQKFWYVRLVRRVFNFASLILVIWIFLTATIYHMHYLRELSYDNMYLDELLDEAALPQTVDLKPEHERYYLRPFSFHMNKVEVSKLYISGIVWSIIIGYICFFVALDFALFQLVDFVVEILREILFTEDLPLINLETKSRRINTSVVDGDETVRYNRTYLSSLRKRLKPQPPAQLVGMTAANSTAGHFSAVMINSTTSLYTTNGTTFARHANTTRTSSSIQAFYDRLMASIEQDVPDDVAILESLEGCLPNARTPFYDIYWSLFYLALFTLGAVIVEAYALRTRHCIANLYYPRRARRRAKWLYRKIISELPKFDAD